MNDEISCPNCGCHIHLEWKTDEEVEQESLQDQTKDALSGEVEE